MNAINGDKYQVTARNNEGVNSRQDVETLNAALAFARSARITGNHMVCIETNGERTCRWDRDGVVGENRWRVTHVNEMEILGRIREVSRR
jgi:hypothetical protein